MSAVHLRPAVASDFAAIAELTNRFVNGTAIHFGYQPVSAADLESSWQRGLARYPWLVAEVDARFAGYAKAGVWRERDAYSWTVETGIYLCEAQRGRGVATALYGRLLRLLARQGFRSVVAGITLPNPPSVALHERLGFVSVGIVRAAGYKLARWHDVGFWQLELSDAASADAIRSPAEAWLESDSE